MMSKHKCKDSPSSIHAVTYTHPELLESQESAQANQMNFISHASHDSQGQTTAQTIHTPFVEDVDFSRLNGIFGALDNDNNSQSLDMYGGEEFSAPLEDDMSPGVVEHQVLEDKQHHSTVSFDIRFDIIFLILIHHSKS